MSKVGANPGMRGKISILSGSVMYIFSCRKIKVSLQSKPKKCYNDIPIKYRDGKSGNVTYAFLDSLSHVIKPGSKEIECSTILPIKWGLPREDGSILWVCSTPQISTAPNCKKPPKLSPMQLRDLYKPTLNSVSDGLYNKAQLKQVSLRQWGALREEMFTTQFRLLSGGNDRFNQRNEGSQNFLDGISDNTRIMIQRFFLPDALQKALWIFNNCWIFITAIFLIHFITSLLSLFGRLHKIYKTEGMTRKLIFALSSGLFSLTVPLSHKCPCNQENFVPTLHDDLQKYEREFIMRRLLDDRL